MREMFGKHTIKITAIIAAALALTISVFALAGCIPQGSGNAGAAQGLTLLVQRVELGVDERTGQESDNAYEFLTKVMTVESKKYSGPKSSTRHEKYTYYDKAGKELFSLLDYGDGRHYQLTIGSNVSTWTFDMTEQNASATDGDTSSETSATTKSA